jgi:fucose permease
MLPAAASFTERSALMTVASGQATQTHNLTAIKWLTYLMFMMFAMTTDSVGKIIEPVMKEYELSNVAAGALHYGPMTAIALAGIFLGYLADKLGRKKTIILGLVIFALNSYLFAVGNAFLYFVALLVISGVSIGIFKTGVLALIGDISVSTSEHTRTMNTCEGFFGVGAIIGPAIVAALLSRGFAWKWLYVIAGVLCTGLIVTALLVKYPKTVKSVEEPIDLKRTMRMMKNPYALGFSLGIFLYVAAECAIYVWMPTLLGSSTFSASEIADLRSVAVKLEQPDRPFDTWLSTQLSPDTHEKLANWKGEDSDKAKQAAQKALLKDLNKVIGGESVFGQQRFGGIALRSETKSLMEQNPQGGNLERLNRLLIEDAYPQEVSKNPLLTSSFGFWAILYALSAFFILRAAGRFMGAWVLAHFKWTSVMAVFSLAIFACFAGSVAGGLWYAVCLLPLSGLFMSMIYPTLNSKGISCFPKTEHGAVSGVILFFTCVSAALGPLAMGAVSDWFKHARYGFVLAAVFAGLLFVGLLINWIYDPAQRRLATLDSSEYQAAINAGNTNKE